eukprot:TRINITY_DN11817_c0_g1_i1.p1 TRINITY_DN11817_c0_g1~~TRINITY_DN11817_c0_g1_i1.p1  ORF type:complete len:527 (-),score=96.50 TRINITY_DN11817_c0_g1_i1:54-1634(-)
MPYNSLKDDSSESQFSVSENNQKKTIIVGGILLLVLLVVVVTIIVLATTKKTSLEDAVKVDNIMTHLRALENSSIAFNRSRAVNLGYNASVEYVLSTLAKTDNLNVTLQPFDLWLWEPTQTPVLNQSSPSSQTFQYGTDFTVLEFSATKTIINIPLIYVGLGCDSSYYTNFVSGSIALILRGTCYFSDKVMVAQSQNAAGAILINNNPREGFISTNVDYGTTIPVFSVPYWLGKVFQADKPTLSMYSYGRSYLQTTYNIIAETKTGKTDRVILVGSHLDSVPAGPGINDNGSGSATILEIAMSIARIKFNPHHKLRFCWWGAEELGLLGSYFYVKDLIQNNREEFNNIVLNLNFDMIASPNFERGIYDANSGVTDFPDVVNASSIIQSLFQNHFKELELAFSLVDFDGRSDYGPFIENGIPAGGLFTGAEVLKTSRGREIYGGIAETAFDPCYHLACDTVENINVGVLSEMSQAVVQVIDNLSQNENLIEDIAKFRNVTKSAKRPKSYLTGHGDILVGSYNYKNRM